MTHIPIKLHIFLIHSFTAFCEYTHTHTDRHC